MKLLFSEKLFFLYLLAFGIPCTLHAMKSTYDTQISINSDFHIEVCDMEPIDVFEEFKPETNELEYKGTYISSDEKEMLAIAGCVNLKTGEGWAAQHRYLNNDEQYEQQEMEDAFFDASNTHDNGQQAQVDVGHEQSSCATDHQKDSDLDSRREMMQDATQRYAAMSDALNTSTLNEPNSAHGTNLPSRSPIFHDAVALIKEKTINNPEKMGQLAQEKAKLEQQLAK